MNFSIPYNKDIESGRYRGTHSYRHSNTSRGI